MRFIDKKSEKNELKGKKIIFHFTCTISIFLTCFPILSDEEFDYLLVCNIFDSINVDLLN